MNTLQLSENLYPVDEVIATFTQCILMRSSIHECLYWLWELIYTFADIDTILYNLYTQFFSISHHSIGKYITRKIKEYNNTRVKRHLADVVCNLRLLSVCPTAYYITYHTTNCIYPTTIYKNHSRMQGYPIYLTGLFGSIRSKKLRNIGYYLNSAVMQYGIKHIYDVLLQYGLSKSIDVDCGVSTKTIGQLELSCLMARCIHSIEHEKTHFIRSNITPVTEMETHFSKPSKRYYHKLQERRLYATHTILPPGKYARFLLQEGLEEACNMHWEYYCFASHEWNKKFCLYGGTQNHKNKSIQWRSDVLLEQFYENDNCMDFDEQSKYVKELSLHDVEIIEDPYIWIERIQSETLTQRISKLSL